MAGPPYAVRPTLRKLARMSRIELHLCSASRGARLLVDGDGGGDVLERCSAAVEDRDFVGPRSARPAARYDFAEFRVDAFATHETGEIGRAACRGGADKRREER